MPTWSTTMPRRDCHDFLESPCTTDNESQLSHYRQWITVIPHTYNLQCQCIRMKLHPARVVPRCERIAKTKNSHTSLFFVFRVFQKPVPYKEVRWGSTDTHIHYIHMVAQKQSALLLRDHMDLVYLTVKSHVHPLIFPLPWTWPSPAPLVYARLQSPQALALSLS